MKTEANQKIKDGGCLTHDFKEPIFDCEKQEGKTVPRWSRCCIRCGLKEYSIFIGTEYIPIPVIIFDDRSYKI